MLALATVPLPPLPPLPLLPPLALAVALLPLSSAGAIAATAVAGQPPVAVVTLLPWQLVEGSLFDLLAMK